MYISRSAGCQRGNVILEHEVTRRYLSFIDAHLAVHCYTASHRRSILALLPMHQFFQHISAPALVPLRILCLALCGTQPL